MTARLPVKPGARQVSHVGGIVAFADLFCGVGGFHYAAHDLGLRCLFACDIDDACQQQYAHNFGVQPHGDVKRIPTDRIPDHDILFAGFPCQPFSIIGDMKGMADARGTLFLEILRVIEAKRPKALVLENVRQLSSIARGEVLSEIRGRLEQAGYSTDRQILNALDFGLPQKRERTIIVGFDDDAMDAFARPQPEGSYKPLKEILEKTGQKTLRQPGYHGETSQHPQGGNQAGHLA